MLVNYLLTAFRNFRRQAAYTLINVAGLALGIASCLVIFLVVRYELGYDQFNSKADRIYRVNLHALDYNPGTSYAVALAFRHDYPELKTASFLYDEGMVEVGNVRYNEKNYVYADEFVPQIFDYQWIAGDSRSALTAPNCIVLTETIAHKYFGNADPMGRFIKVDGKNTCVVTGVIRDLPGNSSMPFPFMISQATIRPDLDKYYTNFYAISMFTFTLVPPQYPIDRINNQMRAFITRNWGKDIAKEATLIIQPLRDVHFDQRYLYNYRSQTTSRDTYYALAGIALFIIITACINFINLSTGQAVTRAKEVGVRKVLGARLPQLIWQFLGETALLVIAAMILGLLAATTFLPLLSRWLDIRISATELGEPPLIALLAGLTVGMILLAGVYPAFVQAAFRPALSLKGKAIGSLRGLTLRRGLVIVQFGISQLLIAGTIIVARQMDYFENRDLGFTKESTLSINVPDSAGSVVLRQQLALDPAVIGYSFSSGAPPYNSDFGPFNAPQHGIPKDDVTEIKRVDEHYFRLFGLHLLAGDTIGPRPGKDSILHVVVNETVVQKMNMADPRRAIGARLYLRGTPCNIIGVVADFQSESKHKKRRACILFYDDHQFYTASLRINPVDVKQAIADIAKKWKAIFPGSVFEYEFLDDHIAGLYTQEEKVYVAFRLFSGIAIFIGCLGLYGLIAFASLQRTREVGIRKVLGASIPDILLLFGREFIVLILVAFLVAAPLAWLAMHNWLENFAYRIGIGWGTFLLSLGASFIIAAVTISYKSIAAAVANPVRSLRAE
jgi:putative ABC transport system permease protein